MDTRRLTALLLLSLFAAMLAALPVWADVPGSINYQGSLTDDTGTLPLVGSERSLAVLVAASAAEPVTVTVEWSPWGLQPLTVHLDDRTLDVGPRADPTFVTAAGGPE